MKAFLINYRFYIELFLIGILPALAFIVNAIYRVINRNKTERYKIDPLFLYGDIAFLGGAYTILALLFGGIVFMVLKYFLFY